ncbi:MAG: N-acetylneuraminate synthase [Deltaproteobacteria bacterium]|nr:N-acetylneuraminate synthase [Deltaproteobacteria bacterium]
MKKTFIIAEAGVNHNGSLSVAKKLVKAAVDAGADAVKFQTFTADEIVCQNAPKASYQNKTTQKKESQYEMLKKLELSPSDHVKIADYCRKKGILFISTPFDIKGVALLDEKIKVPFLKVASGEITNAPLLLKIAATGRPCVLSTGICNLKEVRQALAVLAYGYAVKNTRTPHRGLIKKSCTKKAIEALKNRVTLLHCTSEYPAPIADINLRAMEALKNEFGLPVGLSDHSQGIVVPIAAVALGAVMIEKHFTLDKSLEGPDHKASLEPSELKAMITAIREVELSLGDGLKKPKASEQKNRDVIRKSLVARRQIKRGEVFSEANLTCKRPGTGISPMEYWDYIGKKASRHYQEGELI